ncbi:MAG: cardiolipin synthase [Chloroflexota bacterium]
MLLIFALRSAGPLLWGLSGLTVLIICLLIIADNRMPQSTFAWIFFILLFPILGLVAYWFLGRSHKIFSRERQLAHLELAGPLIQALKPLMDHEYDYISMIQHEKPGSFRRRLLYMIFRNSASSLTAYNQVEILQDASEKYPRLLDDIRRARHSIHLEYFIWTEDEFTCELRDALIERAQAGVRVRALVDQSSFNFSSAYLAGLYAAGVDIRPYRVFMRLDRLHTLNYRSHRKIAVIDGQVGYVGGLNLDREQLPGRHPVGSWRDTHLRMDGEAARVLQASFLVSWFNTTGENLVEPDYYPRLEPGSRPFIPVQITQGGPDSDWKAMQQLYFFMIMDARSSVYIQSPFFIPDESLLDAIRAAALAGVDVRIMCQPRGGSYQVPYRAAYTYYADVVRAGARVYLYQDGYFHAKTIQIDSAICAIGTANMDVRSFYLNYETMAVIYDEAIARELEADFLQDQKHCVEWRLEEYLKTPWPSRLLDSLYRLASPVM